MKLSDAIESVINDPFQIRCPVCDEMRMRAKMLGSKKVGCAECPFNASFMQRELGVRPYLRCSMLRVYLKRGFHIPHESKFIYESIRFVQEMMMNLRSIGD